MIRPRPAAARVVAGLVAGICTVAVAAVAMRAGGLRLPAAADWQALRFTVLQAGLSALASSVLALPVARALARNDFAGRRLLVTALGAPFILPVIVAVLGLLAVFGRNGWISQLLGLVGLPPLTVYGLHGIVLAHVFFNLPLATRLLLNGWAGIPAEQFRLGRSLGFTHGQFFRQVEVPMLVTVLPGAMALIFLVSASSFAVALILGGGPGATTLELAIYQAFRFDFDLGRAASLGMLQLVLCLAAAGLARATGAAAGPMRGADAPARGLLPTRPLADPVAVGLAAMFLLVPIAAVIVRGIAGLDSMPASVWTAAMRSVGISVAASALATLAAFAVATTVAARDRGHGLAEAIGYVTVALSPLVLGTGLFIALFSIADPVALALPITALVNALMALPFALRVLVPPTVAVYASYHRLGLGLAMTPGNWLRLVLLPRLRAPLGFAAGIAAALSMGDLGVIALFGAPDAGTLPLELFRLMGSYRTDDAQAAAVLLLVLSFGLFAILDRGARIGTDL